MRSSFEFSWLMSWSSRSILARTTLSRAPMSRSLRIRSASFWVRTLSRRPRKFSRSDSFASSRSSSRRVVAVWVSNFSFSRSHSVLAAASDFSRARSASSFACLTVRSRSCSAPFTSCRAARRLKTNPTQNPTTPRTKKPAIARTISTRLMLPPSKTKPRSAV